MKNHNSSSVTEILWERQTDQDPVTLFKDICVIVYVCVFDSQRSKGTRQWKNITYGVKQKNPSVDY